MSNVKSQILYMYANAFESLSQVPSHPQISNTFGPNTKSQIPHIRTLHYFEHLILILKNGQ